MLDNKHILLGVTGSIAAYKAAVLCRLLRKAGAEVKVVMTPAAKEFITPLTMATLSQNPIAVEFYNPENGDWHSHIKMGLWADCFLIAPASANTIAKMACGIADNLLLTTYLSARCKVVVAPAMDCDMYAHTATQTNIATLKSRGVEVIDSGEGFLASGLEGKGRMAEPEQIVEAVEQILKKKSNSLCGKRFIVTAGATQEPIDPVRYITNHSTGKMGYAIAAALQSRGAEVVLISTPTALPTPYGVQRVDVTTADQMYKSAVAEFEKADGAVMCAAVADYTPSQVADHKIKKSDNDLNISLRRTKDIAATLGATKGKKLVVCFALETDHEKENATQKLYHKNADMVVLNSLKESGAGFGVDTNRVCLITKKNIEDWPLLQKSEVAEVIVDKIEELLKEREQC